MDFGGRILDDEAVEIAQGVWQDDVPGRVVVIPTNSFESPGSTDTIAVPEFWNSPATLEFCGFRREIAQTLFNNYAGNPHHTRIDLVEYETIVEFAQEYIRERAISHESSIGSERMQELHWNDKFWYENLADFGISQDLISRIMDENFREIRLTATASEWTIDTVQMSWEFLHNLERRIKKSKKNRTQASKAHSATPRQQITSIEKFIPELLNESVEESQLALIDLRSIPQSLHDSLKILFKGGTRSRLDRAFNRNEKRVNIHELFSTPPTDFHNNSSTTLYFSEQFEVAEKYAFWANRREPRAEAGILQVAVPGDILSSTVHVPDSIWDRLVWFCRRRDLNYRTPSQDLQGLLGAEILSGALCPQSHDTVQRLRGQEELIKFTLRSGAFATQTVFLELETFRDRGPQMLWVVSSLRLARAVDQDLRVISRYTVP